MHLKDIAGGKLGAKLTSIHSVPIVKQSEGIGIGFIIIVPTVSAIT
jgi:hypothetical protein